MRRATDDITAAHLAKAPSFTVLEKTYDEKTCEVHISSRLTLADYEKVAPPPDIELLKLYAKALVGKKITYINATYAGGGVAIMRAPLIALLNAAGVDAHWYVLKPNDEVFKITKQKFHNVLQDVAGPGVELTAEDKRVYEAWIKRNAEALARPISEADVIVIDDWQPSGLIPHIKGDENKPGLNPHAKIIFRDHIHTEGVLMSTPDTPQYVTWQFIWNRNRVRDVEVFAVHPRDEFVPPDVPDEKVVFVPATSDLLDDLNRPLSESETEAGYAFINEQLELNHHQTPLDLSRRYLVLFARFDPSKGMPEGMSAYALARDKITQLGVASDMLPQLVVMGNGSVDDPDGQRILAEVMNLRSTKYAAIKDDIKIARMPHNDIAVNALIRNSTIALQPSIKEGFENRVTDAILQGVPVIGSARGGIPLQIIEGQSGFVIDPEDTEQWAERICELITNKTKYKQMSAQCRYYAKAHNYEFTTVPNALNWLHLSHVLLTRNDFVGNRQWVKNLRGPAVIDLASVH